jgi:bifunctional DNA-binding transcriptional regulator/antitoxin component of YhaV-PrlF toxin-antitoxin module
MARKTVDGKHRHTRIAKVNVVDAKRSHIVPVGGRGTLTLPAEFRKRFAIGENTLVQITEEADGLMLRPVRVVPAGAPQPADLDALLAGVTPANVHGEVDTGPVVGKEFG